MSLFTRISTDVGRVVRLSDQIVYIPGAEIDTFRYGWIKDGLGGGGRFSEGWESCSAECWVVLPQLLGRGDGALSTRLDTWYHNTTRYIMCVLIPGLCHTHQRSDDTPLFNMVRDTNRPPPPPYTRFRGITIVPGGGSFCLAMFIYFTREIENESFIFYTSG